MENEEKKWMLCLVCTHDCYFKKESKKIQIMKICQEHGPPSILLHEVTTDLFLAKFCVKWWLSMKEKLKSNVV